VKGANAMAKETLAVQVWRRGSMVDTPARTALRAGPLSLFFEQGELRGIRLGEREVINRIYVAVRDRNWDTAPAVLSNLSREAGDSHFRVSFDVSCRMREIDFSWKGLITGDADGTIVFSMDGQAHTTFLRNRVGFCVLHPDSCAGAPCVLTHTSGGGAGHGAEERAAFPRFVSPHQPFLDLAGMSHEVAPGTWASLSFTGDVFETEDQRNWTDSSFKTYCTPIALPFPAEITAGTVVRQSVTLRITGPGVAGGPAAWVAAQAAGGPARVSVEADTEGRPVPLPGIGLGVASHGGALSATETARLAAMKLDHLRGELDLSAPDWEAALRRASAEAAALSASLLVALHLSEAAEAELAALAASLRRAPCTVGLWFVFKRGESCTADKWVALARAALGPLVPGARFASGTNAYFTELNRGTPPGPVADCLVYSANPQIHAVDDLTVMENLSAQAATVTSALRISGGRPVAVSPVTLKARFNAVATGPIPTVPPGELPPQVDPRQMSLQAAAWTVGSMASLARAGAAIVTYYETTGWRGVMETEKGPPVPEKFPALPGCVFPVYHPLADIGEMRGGMVLPCAVTPSGAAAAIIVEANGKRRALVANLSQEEIAVTVAGGHGPRRARIRLLDETSVGQACRAPETWRAHRGEERELRDGALEIRLLPYAVARIDWEEE